jgi:hypothetical protein
VENYERAFEAIEAGVPSDMAWRAAYSYVGIDNCDAAIDLCLEALRHNDDLDTETMEYVQRAYYYAIEHACFPFANEVDKRNYIKDVYEYQECRPFEDSSTAPLQESRKELSRLDSKEIPEKHSGNVRTFLQLNIQRLEFMQKRIELLDAVPTISDDDRKLPKVANEPNPLILLTAGVLTIASVFASYVTPQILNLPIMMALIFGLLIVFMIWLAVYLSSKDERKRAEKQLKEKTKQADEAYKYADNYGLGQVKAITEKLRKMKR